MSTTLLLPGIRQRKVSTDRLAIAYLEAGTGSVPVVLIHGNCSSSLFFQDCMLALAARGRYTVYAPDMRGHAPPVAKHEEVVKLLAEFMEEGNIP